MMKALYLLFLWVTLFTPVAYAQGSNEVALTIQLRASDGAPLGGVTVILERLPDAAARSPECQTNQGGLCTWSVAPGLYQVRFPVYTLDDLSALALAEGGLSGLGVTVGESAIRYAFTVQDDGHVYFDATPDAAVPTPRLPIQTDLSGGVIISPAQNLVTESEAVVTATVANNHAEANALDVESPPWWHRLTPIGAGIFLGVIGWLGQRYLNGAFTKPSQTGRLQEKEEVR